MIGMRLILILYLSPMVSIGVQQQQAHQVEGILQTIGQNMKSGRIWKEAEMRMIIGIDGKMISS